MISDIIQENQSIASMRLIRACYRAADRITHQNKFASVPSLLSTISGFGLDQLSYADKVAGLVSLNWTQDELRKWASDGYGSPPPPRSAWISLQIG
jgi:hypothetical protein